MTDKNYANIFRLVLFFIGSILFMGLLFDLIGISKLSSLVLILCVANTIITSFYLALKD